MNLIKKNFINLYEFTAKLIESRNNLSKEVKNQ